jgi:elongation factor G
VKERLHGNPVPIQYPIGGGDEFSGIVDLVAMKYFTFEGEKGEDQIEHEIPAEHKAEAEKRRAAMIDAVASQDPELEDAYLNHGTLTNEQIAKGLKFGVQNYKLQPMLCGAALRNKGVQLLLDAVVDYLPDPLSVHNMNQFDMSDTLHTQPIPTKPDPKAPLRALVFKVMNMPGGELSFVRVYQGTLKTGDQLIVANTGKKERASRLVKLIGAAQSNVDDALAGDICAIVGLKFASTGETLCHEDEEHAMLEGITFAKPVITMAIEPKSNQDKEKLAYALSKMEREDPTFKKWVDPETAQLIVAGMGELHLEVLQHRMLDDFKVDAVVGKPRVSYRETITKTIEIRGKHVKQSGGRGQYGDCILEVRPLTDEEKKAGNEFIFVNGTRGGSVPKEYVGPIEEGVKNELARGYVLGYPCINVHVTLIDGSYHDVDSSEHAFVAAGALAIRLGYPKLGVQVLEPWMLVEVETPDEFTGSIMGSLNSKRAMITETAKRGPSNIIRCEVPLGEMFGYTTDLRSMSQGRASYSMEPSEYKAVPNSMLEKLKKAEGAKTAQAAE